MRLPTDAILAIAEGADDELAAVWREERLPVLTLSADAAALEAALEALGATTLVLCGQGAEAAARTAARLGYRVFLIGADPVEGDDVKVVTRAMALAAARLARARERWKAARAGL